MIDLYCERLGPGLWAEPFNVLSNLAFLAAALASWQLARRSGALTGSIALLIALMAAIGAGSAPFHMFATGWARILDVIPIVLFMIAFLWLYLRDVVLLPSSRLLGMVGAFLVASLIARAMPYSIEWSLQYAPALVVLVGLDIYHWKAGKQEPLALLGATGVLAVALLFRTVDQPMCPSIPVGTHFLWHLLTPVVLYLAFRGLVLNAPVESPRP